MAAAKTTWSAWYKAEMRKHDSALKRRMPGAGRAARAIAYAKWLAERDGLDVSWHKAVYCGSAVTFRAIAGDGVDVTIEIPNAGWSEDLPLGPDETSLAAHRWPAGCCWSVAPCCWSGAPPLDLLNQHGEG